MNCLLWESFSFALPSSSHLDNYLLLQLYAKDRSKTEDSSEQSDPDTLQGQTDNTHSKYLKYDARG